MTQYIENDNIDAFSIATNGLISSEEKTFILDPLGYYVLKVKEDVVVVDERGYTAGGGYARRAGGAATKKKKRIRLEVTFPKEVSDKKFIEEFYLDDFNLTVSDARLSAEDEITLTISNPEIGDSFEKPIKISVTNVKID